MKHSSRFLSLVNGAKTRIEECSVEDVVLWLTQKPDLKLVDIREESEWGAGHAAGAIHLGRGILERDAEAHFPDLDTPLVLYCGGGFRSALSADSLNKMGYTKVWSLAGGWKAWKAAGHPTEG